MSMDTCIARGGISHVLSQDEGRFVAEVLSDDDDAAHNDNDTNVRAASTSPSGRLNDPEDPLEASLEIPSLEQLKHQLEPIRAQLAELGACAPDRVARADLDCLTLALNRTVQATEFDDQLVAVGKTLFVLSKDSANDDAFCSVAYIESVLSAIATATECLTQRPSSSRPRRRSLKQVDAAVAPLRVLIYLAGTLKNSSSGDEKMLKLLATHGAIARFSESLEWRSAQSATTKEIAQFLVQATNVLRNLSTSKSSLKQFAEAQVAPRLCEMVTSFLEHTELMVNVSRILGKLTLHEAPRSQINQTQEHGGRTGRWS
ncbi:hypothetical protein P43SY_000928 [Pythium insidiosum]|uniref:Uncharacterized protein n=1 Tax=Pythium insidiosum TaxID=114742 RepID=A0AAD5Q4F7_PYTIN|nr:hypothetical protein P43SY_000928 [Pythium insidiosum]